MATIDRISTVTDQINNLITDEHNEEVTGTILNTVFHLVKDLAPVSDLGTFNNASLDSESNLTIEHPLDTLFPDVFVKDNNGRVLSPTNFEFYVIDNTHIRIGMGGPIEGEYSYKIVKND